MKNDTLFESHLMFKQRKYYIALLRIENLFITVVYTVCCGNVDQSEISRIQFAFVSAYEFNWTSQVINTTKRGGSYRSCICCLFSIAYSVRRLFNEAQIRQNKSHTLNI